MRSSLALGARYWKPCIQTGSRERTVGKTIVITGAGIGLGRAIARRFARDGETVILLGRTLSKVQSAADELGEPHFAVECDVGSPDSVRAAFAEIARRHAKTSARPVSGQTPMAMKIGRLMRFLSGRLRPLLS